MAAEIDLRVASSRRYRWWRSGVFPMLLLYSILLGSLYLLSNATENSAAIGPYYAWLLLGNAIGLVILASITAYQLYRLGVEYWQRQAGIRLTLRMVAMSVILAIVPVSLVYLISVQFLQRGIDSWFDVRIEKALGDSLYLSRDAMAGRIREQARETLKMAEALKDTPMAIATLEIVNMRLTSGAEEIAILDTQGRIYAFSNANPEILVPHTPSDLVYSQIKQGYPYLDMEPIEDQGFFIRVVMEIPESGSLVTGDRRVIQTLFPVSSRLNTLAQSVQSAFAAYKELSYIRDELKQSFVLTLSLVFVLNILAAIIVGVVSARHLAAPIRVLVDGTRAVAAGDYEKRLPITTKDELGLLVHSFNTMTARVAEASQLARRSQEQAEEEHAHLQTILARLSSGVITLDSEGNIVTMNPMSATILFAGDEDFCGRPFRDMLDQYPHLVDLFRNIARNIDGQKFYWQEENVLQGKAGRQVLMVSGTRLSPERGHEGEHVIMFDDITELVRAQRNAAWGEMARRLAHEIKNPLTPIQLSAERMRRKCLGSGIDDHSAEVLDKATNTIIDQVKAMKEMVDAFTQYARSPALKLELLDINQLIYKVLDMYNGRSPSPEVIIQLDDTHPLIMADTGRMRQLLHNLINNALDAAADEPQPRLKFMTQVDGQHLLIVLEDNGPGFDRQVIDNVFEPYVTTKDSGTGLGLAIVKKIVEEHHATINIRNLAPRGASVCISLPIPDDPVTAMKPSGSDGEKG